MKANDPESIQNALSQMKLTFEQEKGFNQVRFKLSFCTITWYPSTKTLLVQGKNLPGTFLDDLQRHLLNVAGPSPSEALEFGVSSAEEPASILLVWERNPEGVDFYLLPKEVVTKEQLGMLENNHLIGSGKFPSTTEAFLGDATAEGGAWEKFKINPPILFKKIEKVFYSGIFL